MKRQNKPLVSVIVPIYNAGKYLSACLESISNQTYKNLEIILVDDKSTDNSAEVAKMFVKKDRRAKLVEKKVNQGINPARQTGFENSTGDYIMFVDDDDLLTNDLVADHLGALEKTKADVSIGRAVWWNNGDELNVQEIRKLGSGKLRVLDKKNAYRTLITELAPFANSEVGILWNKVHKRSFFEGYDWSKSNMPSEDFMTNAYLFDGLDSVVFIDQFYYFHRTNIGSTMDKLSQKKGANSRQKIDIFDALKKVAETFEKTSKRNDWNFENEILFFKYRYFYIRTNAFISGNRFSEGDFEKLKKYTSLKEIEKLCSVNFSRYVSEFIYAPGSRILPDIAKLWNDFAKSEDFGEFLQRRTNDATEKLKQEKIAKDIANQEVAYNHAQLENIQSLRGSAFNFLGKVKHKVIKNGAANLTKRIRNAKLEKKYQNCWLVMDRPDSASDNGYAFYKYILKNHPEINAYFVINKSSSDVPKLQKQGFKLIFIGTKDHEIALRCSSRLLYAHFTFEYANDTAKRIFLSHGIAKDNIPNPGLRQNDYCIATINEEYKFMRERTDMQTVKIGLSRYDELTQKSRNFAGKKDKIIIAPTWRIWLYRDPQQIKKDNYFVNWQKFLQSKELKKLSQKYKIVFITHPMMTKINDGKNIFKLPDFVKSITYAELGLERLQDLLVQSELLITDFSSIFFDAVVAGADVVYFQFDEKDYREKGILQDAWFDYKRDGFGPIYKKYEDFVKYIGRYDSRVDKKCQKRQQALKDEIFNAGNVSEKIVQFAINIDEQQD